ncbi:MAG TPA: bifunctional UDP-sugar hydrolase/5'-nucleotidase, partial [bacterium]|nr:bifunctional UDP-sugar hydrolase/5'-nucleotidase [bacterium]
MRKITMIVATLGTLFFSAVSHAKVCKLTILHFNDMHGYLEPEDDDLGGAARIATLVDKIRAENIEEGRG